jgi:hypothetical protein
MMHLQRKRRNNWGAVHGDVKSEECMILSLFFGGSWISIKADPGLSAG